MAHCETDARRPSIGESLTALTYGDTIGQTIIAAFNALRTASARRREKARRDWLRYTTDREIAQLPPEVRKDIGWPQRRND
ncbi:hypothetical protein [Pararhizobium haloflavum]|uniref:hypothetical protein n=1 Tax=Pararhizobium haloflavum TaxID=2037914 RepID=UPI000C17D9C8|nr:hypothetical protein [Pararhizobium haloflavum]